jgi:hypothetical protein
MSKRVSNKRRNQLNKAPARSRIHLGFHKTRKLNNLNAAAGKHSQDEEVMTVIRAAIRGILPKRFFRRGVR